MANWKPATREPDPLRACIYDYLRNRAPKVYLEGGNGPRALGKTTETMSNGEPLTLDLTLAPVGVDQSNGRPRIVFAVSGHVAERSAGYSVDGRVVIDQASLAFLAIEATPTRVNVRG
ncbi:hypothetical protein GCM10011316_17480 [Roseibium aquae]|uniref:Uncharacterized protein n=1 Tax=Roseibium aquae TaxID=1323746 RepID=A0A916TIC1_9HYPH|nr:hypothetical protein [Roseibium aquae]GGB45873.1 hypothetical protein GCM10011316_17480 [Roseibium aquae]